MSEYRYDDAVLRTPITHEPDNTGLSVPGTAASNTVLLRKPVATPRKINHVRMRLITGGTAAGPTITFGKSAAGTGTVSPIGTHAFGTSADGAVASLDLSDTELDPGDELVVTNVAGTVAATPKIIFEVGYVD